MRNESEVENEIKAKGLNAPRLTPADIDAAIMAEHYLRVSDACAALGQPAHPATQCLTLCVLVLRNGFTVTGESACVSPENFNAELGRKIARDNARNKIWAFEGYLLRERLHQQSSSAA